MTFKQYMEMFLEEKMQHMPYKRKRIRKKKAKMILMKAWRIRQDRAFAKANRGLMYTVTSAMQQVPRRGYPMRLARR